MRKFMIMAASAALFLAPAAYAQGQTQPTPPAERQAPTGAPTIQNISIVDITELPAETQTQVSQIEAQRSEEELAQLRQSIDAVPQIKAALEAKGLSSAVVIVASLSQAGELTLVTRQEDS